MAGNHVCIPDLEKLAIALQPVVFDSLPVEISTRKQVAEVLGQHADVPDEQLNAFVNEIQSIDAEDVKTAKRLYERGRNREEIRVALREDMGTCGKCQEKYRALLLSLVDKFDYATIAEADEAMIGYFP